MMFVKYTGFGEIISEYNGKLVMFNSNHRVREITQEAYDELQRCGMVESCYLHIMTHFEVAEYLEKKKAEDIVAKTADNLKHPDWYVDTIKYNIKNKRSEDADKMLEEALVLYPDNKRLQKLKEFIEQETE
jgi:pterin-4a-carbinolamine dehydratase